MATSISCNILQLFDYLSHYSHGHLLSIRLGIRCLSCSITFWLSQTCCFLSANMHSCYSCTLISHADCHMFNYCFSFHTSPLCTFLPSVLSAYLHSLLAAYFSLFAPHCYCPLTLNLLYHCIFFTPVYSLLFARSLPLACLFSHAPLLSNAHLLPTYHSMRPCDPFHAGHFIPPVASASWWLYVHSLGTLHFAHGPPRSMHLHHLYHNPCVEYPNCLSHTSCSPVLNALRPVTIHFKSSLHSHLPLVS